MQNIVNEILIDIYTSGIYAEGYIVFVFPFVHLSVRMFVHSYVRDSVPFVELLKTLRHHGNFSV